MRTCGHRAARSCDVALALLKFHSAALIVPREGVQILCAMRNKRDQIWGKYSFSENGISNVWLIDRTWSIYMKQNY